MDQSALDVRVFDAAPTQLFADDRRSIITMQRLVSRAYGRYAYLEIGSYLGGSLQPYLMDDACVALYSIDTRPALQPDERGERFEYPDNTTQRMLETLRPAYGDRLGKLRCFDMDAKDVKVTDLSVRPRLCFIDGEHTDVAVLSDFRACLSLMEFPGVIMFDDSHIVYRGIKACVDEARARSLQFRAYVLPSKIGVIEIGNPSFYRDETVLDLLASPSAYLYLSEALDHYRRLIMRIKDIPGIRFIRGFRNRVLGRGGAMGGSRSR